MNGGECLDQPADAERASGHMAEGASGTSPFTRGSPSFRVLDQLHSAHGDTNAHNHPVLLGSHFVICTQVLKKVYNLRLSNSNFKIFPKAVSEMWSETYILTSSRSSSSERALPLLNCTIWDKTFSQLPRASVSPTVKRLYED